MSTQRQLVRSKRNTLSDEQKKINTLRREEEKQRLEEIMPSALTKAQKKAIFKSRVDDCINGINAVNYIATKFTEYKKNKDVYIDFKDVDDNVWKLTPAERSAFVKKVSEQLLDLNKLFAKALNRKKEEKLEVTSFKGVYSVVLAGDALKAFFGILPGGRSQPRFGATTTGDLIDNLPFLKRTGLLLRNTATLLFFLYAKNNGRQFRSASSGDKIEGQYSVFDDHMNYAFNGTIPAAYTPEINHPFDENKYALAVSEGKKYNYDVAVPKKLNTTNLNTVNAIRSNKVKYDTELTEAEKSRMISISVDNKLPVHSFKFDTRKFPTFMYQNIATLNYYTKKEIDIIAGSGSNAPLVQRMREANDILNNSNPEVSRKAYGELAKEHAIVEQYRMLLKQANDKRKAQQ